MFQNRSKVINKGNREPILADKNQVIPRSPLSVGDQFKTSTRVDGSASKAPNRRNAMDPVMENAAVQRARAVFDRAKSAANEKYRDSEHRAWNDYQNADLKAGLVFESSVIKARQIYMKALTQAILDLK